MPDLLNKAAAWYKEQMTDEAPAPLSPEQKRANRKSLVDQAEGTTPSAESGDGQAKTSQINKPTAPATTSWSIDKRFKK